MNQTVQPTKQIETVAVSAVSGRVLAEKLVAEIDNPPFDRAPVDGYACIAEDVKSASKDNPVRLQVLEEIDAGQYSEVTVNRGQAVRIMTGAAIPRGCNCCIRQEDTDYGEEIVCIYAGVEAWKNYCFRGEDFKKGTVMIPEGTRMSYVEAGIAASMGKNKVSVYAQPRIALLTSGDELIPPGRTLQPGKIYNSNQTMLAARLTEFGLNPVIVASIPDDGHEAAKVMHSSAEVADIIITTGGVSVGKKDIMHEALPELGAEQIFWKVLLKPGTPTIFSVYQGTPIASLSGNPFGVAVNFELLIRPMLARMMHDESILPVRKKGVMAGEFLKASKGRRFIRGRWEDGKIYMPDGLHSSGVLGSMQGCNCLVDICPGTEALHIGDEVEAVLI